MTVDKYYKLGIHYNFLTGKFEYEDGKEVIEYYYYVDKSAGWTNRRSRRTQLYIKDIGCHPKFGDCWLIVDKWKLKKLLGLVDATR